VNSGCECGASRCRLPRIINNLHREGVLAFEANPHHWLAQRCRPDREGQTGV
jgi:hypothetical protein